MGSASPPSPPLPPALPLSAFGLTAHFLEHMIFKGTADRTVRQLEEEIENMGGHLNVYTTVIHAHQSTTGWKYLGKYQGKSQRKPAVFTGSEVRIIDDDIPLAQFAVAFNGASWTEPDSIALMVISELAHKCAINDVAESIMAFNTNYEDTGLFGVYAVAKISKLSYRVSEADVTLACNQLKSSLQLHMDGPKTAWIDAVDASTIKHVANRFIFDQDVAIAAMGLLRSSQDNAEPICSATSFLFINSKVLLLFCLIVLITNALRL
ncbi:hypothetical protein J5N97_015861 [Dioscorea zingiberensis]|uniref:Peptidase M16 N-terminal domain-containing protein n=1 Tax=Dioscorea zingiberensis TaxID=325984 RepID=A0A9D5CIB3_9LILI|nr:hypothetical protein J5N97_015861 [Dioscorea zingiberensis]